MNHVISPKGLSFLKSWEELRLNIYHGKADAPGVFTIGWGHKVLRGEVYPPDGIDEAWADKILLHDLQDPTGTVNTLVHVPLTQNEADALIDFTFNEGQGNFRKSTLLRLLNRGDLAGAGQQFLVWDKADGKEVEGLSDRRQKEKDIFENGIYVNHA